MAAPTLTLLRNAPMPRKLAAHERRNVTRTFATSAPNDRYVKRIARQHKVTYSTAVHLLIENARLAEDAAEGRADHAEGAGFPRRRSTDHTLDPAA